MDTHTTINMGMTALNENKWQFVYCNYRTMQTMTLCIDYVFQQSQLINYFMIACCVSCDLSDIVNFLAIYYKIITYLLSVAAFIKIFVM